MATEAQIEAAAEALALKRYGKGMAELDEDQAGDVRWRVSEFVVVAEALGLHRPDALYVGLPILDETRRDAARQLTHEELSAYAEALKQQDGAE